ncbi:MAG: tRNA uridine-5-carboxymethylaminomethyl(34) synthesis GTPase MnmE [Gammaproteobacteria bacterium]|nr:tRNA uridine-5-carboxymethylaminomethyl(34) synthesis GTPase MnmE [Gammaproteobacteria bacterium]
MSSSVETIVAIATPPGYGGVGMVRLSGPLSYDIATHLTSCSFQPQHIKVCQFLSQESEVMDKGIVLYFKAPHSFTGEDIIELHGHGSPVVLDQLVTRCVELGARLAEPGEFSLRAFLNGKIDLLQAEAIADLIHASSETAAKMAMQSLQGVFSQQIHTLHDELVRLRVYLEAMIDFPDEEVDFLSKGQVKEKLAGILAHMDQLQSTAKQGSMIREGVVVVIAGPPNAGKSTLMNALAGRDVAIVTELAGTTRDVMRECILLEGVPLTLVDTAGLRETECVIEQEGIKRAYEMLKQAALVLFVQDVNQIKESPTPENPLLSAISPLPPVLTIYNKMDTQENCFSEDKSAIYISAQLGKGISELKQALLKAVGYRPQEGVFIARRRHLEALARAKTALETAIFQLNITPSVELVAEDLRASHMALSAITGQFTSDDLLGEIFSTFCIGK